MRHFFALLILFAGASSSWAIRPLEEQRRDAARFSALSTSRPVSRKHWYSAQSAVFTAAVDPERGAREFLRKNLGLDPENLVLEKTHSRQGMRHFLFSQVLQGIPVEFSRIKVHLDSSGRVLGFQSNAVQRPGVSARPSLDQSRAWEAVERDLGRGLSRSPGRLVFFPEQPQGALHLAWKLKVHSRDFVESWTYYVDAHDGSLLFRYSPIRFACQSSGTVTGPFYPVSPLTSLSTAPFANQTVWVKDASTFTVTDAGGSFCSQTAGKIFTSLRGPFVSVANHKVANAHYDNGGGQWFVVATPLSSPSPYPNDSRQIQTLTAPSSAVKVRTHFSFFDVGSISSFGSGDFDRVMILDVAGSTVAAYVGSFLSPFVSADVAGNTINIQLVSNESGQGNGYQIDVSSFLALTNSPDVPDNLTSTFTWSSSNSLDGTLDEMNVFHHLNSMHDYFSQTIGSPNKAMIDLPIVASVHVGEQMNNAFFDPEFKSLSFGDGSFSRPFSLDATVVRHEYVHFVQEQVYPLFNFGQSGALSEALADYFSASSLDVSLIAQYSLGSEGAGTRELDAGNTPVFPNGWTGEVHDDSLYLSRALWKVRTRLGQSAADRLTFDAMFFFPDSFEDFLEAMILADQAAFAGANAAALREEFSKHGIATTLASGQDSFEFNDGPEVATDVSTRTSLSATINPSADIDAYTFAMAPGRLSVSMALPAHPSVAQSFFAYALTLLDSSRRPLASAGPVISNGIGGFCQAGIDCRTTDSSVTLTYDNSSSGQFYLLVTGAFTGDEGPSVTSSTIPYRLSFSYEPAGVFSSRIVQASFDNDLISFSVGVSSFAVQEYVFDHAGLRDHSLNVLALTDTSLPGALLAFVSSSTILGGGIQGELRLQSGFDARHPSAGTVFVEIFGKDRLERVHSLGLSQPLNLSPSKAELKAFNNVFNPLKGEKATIRYETQSAGHVSLKLYTLNGTLVKVLVDEAKPAGKGSVDWEGVNLGGRTVASGIYLIHLKAPGISKTQKVVVVK